MAVNTFRDLRVWQSGMDLVGAIYEATRLLPKSETYGLAGQAQRAAVPVPANTAEGHTRRNLREYLHLLIYRPILPRRTLDIRRSDGAPLVRPD